MGFDKVNVSHLQLVHDTLILLEGEGNYTAGSQVPYPLL